MTRGGLQTWIHFFSMLQYLCKKDQRSLYTLETAAKLTFVSHPSEVLKPRIITIFINTWQRHEDSKKNWREVDLKTFFADDGNLVLESPLDILSVLLSFYLLLRVSAKPVDSTDVTFFVINCCTNAI